MSGSPQTYRVQVADVVRELPLIQVAPNVQIAFVDCLNDAELTHAAVQALAPKLKPFAPQALVTPEAKSIPLVYGLAVALGCPYITLRKTPKAYMQTPLKVHTESITAGGETQTLYFDARYRERVVGKRVVLVDDVVSTGSTIQAMAKLMEQVGAKVVARAAIFTEGDPNRWQDVIALGHLPIFVNGKQG